MNKLFFLSILFLSSSFVLIRAPDVEPPIIVHPPQNTTESPTTTTTETSVVSTTPLEPENPENEFVCPLNCTCTEVKPNRHCCPTGFYFNPYWNMCLVRQMPHPRYYRQLEQYAQNKYRTCDSGFSFNQGKCVKRDGDIVIFCKFPQKELPCCHIEFPKKCQKSQWGENCFITTYYYCGEMCIRKDNLSEADLNNLVKNQMKQQQWQSRGMFMCDFLLFVLEY